MKELAQLIIICSSIKGNSNMLADALSCLPFDERQKPTHHLVMTMVTNIIYKLLQAHGSGS
jgi:hypothetical protein